MAPEAKRVNIIDIFIIEGYECNCLTMLTSMLTFVFLMFLTVKPMNDTINQKRLKEVRVIRRCLDSEENPQESIFSRFLFFLTIFFCTKMFFS